MSRAQKKQMLVVSLQSTETKKLRILFESEDHYMYKDELQLKRVMQKYVDLYSFKTEALLNDYELCSNLGFSILITLTAIRRLRDEQKSSDYPAMVLYQYERHGKQVIKVDDETYVQKLNRTYCTSFPLPSLDLDKFDEDNGFYNRVGQTAIAHLPLDPNDKKENWVWV